MKFEVLPFPKAIKLIPIVLEGILIDRNKRIENAKQEKNTFLDNCVGKVKKGFIFLKDVKREDMENYLHSREMFGNHVLIRLDHQIDLAECTNKGFEKRLHAVFNLMRLNKDGTLTLEDDEIFAFNSFLQDK